MRIIGNTSKDNFLVEMTEDELAKCSGVTYASSMASTPQVGHAICVSNIYNDAKETLTAYAEIKKDLTNVQNRIAKLLSMMQPQEAKK